MDGEKDQEVVFKDVQEESALPTPVTTLDMDVIIRGWEEKFANLTECLREVQLASERTGSDMCLINQEARAQGQEQDRRLGTMQEGLTDFLRRFQNIQTTPHVDALRASTPQRRFPDFGFETSPVGRDEVSHPEHNTLPHTRGARTADQADSMETHMGSARSTLPHIRSARTEDQDDVQDTRNTVPHIMSARTGDREEMRETRNTLRHTSSARTGEHVVFRDTHIRDEDDAFGDTRIRDQDDIRDARTREYSDEGIARSRDLRFRLDERPTHKDDKRNSAEIQQNSFHPGNNTSLSRSSSSPKVPTFDGTNTAQFRPWIIQFEAIARHQGWTAGDRVVRLVSSLTGPAANLLIGMTLGQLDNYNVLRTRLSRRYDPPEREEAHCAELRARNNSPGRNPNNSEQQRSPKFNQGTSGNARTPNPTRRQTPVRDIMCWTCGKSGHYAFDCKSGGTKLAFAPKAVRMNFLQQIAAQVQGYCEEEQNPRSGNE